MPTPAKKKRPGRRGLKLSLYPLTADEAVPGIFHISKEDAKRIVASKAGKAKRGASK